MPHRGLGPSVCRPSPCIWWASQRAPPWCSSCPGCCGCTASSQVRVRRGGGWPLGRSRLVVVTPHKAPAPACSSVAKAATPRPPAPAQPTPRLSPPPLPPRRPCLARLTCRGAGRAAGCVGDGGAGRRLPAHRLRQHAAGCAHRRAHRGQPAAAAPLRRAHRCAAGEGLQSSLLAGCWGCSTCSAACFDPASATTRRPFPATAAPARCNPSPSPQTFFPTAPPSSHLSWPPRWWRRCAPPGCWTGRAYCCRTRGTPRCRGAPAWRRRCPSWRLALGTRSWRTPRTWEVSRWLGMHACPRDGPEGAGQGAALVWKAHAP